jgi:hypothetical protein
MFSRRITSLLREKVTLDGPSENPGLSFSELGVVCVDDEEECISGVNGDDLAARWPL